MKTMRLTLLAAVMAAVAAHALAEGGQAVAIAAAANLSSAGPELAAAFAVANPPFEARVRYASTGNLAAQIRQGSPDEVFLSADMETPEALAAEGLAAGAPRPYATGKLILFMRQGLPETMRPTSGFAGGGTLAALGVSSVASVAIADPKTAPYGRAAAQALSKSKAMDALQGRLVFASNISQAAQYALSAADAAFIAASSLRGSSFSGFKRGEHWLEVDPSLHEPIRQGLVLLETSKGAEAFAAFMLSEKARSVLAAWGYGGP
jgi:molybdate transport system substrate-binding protein